MSGDDVARALGAGGTTTVEIGGKPCTARPLSARELATVERICIEEYKDRFLADMSRNLSKLPDKRRRNTLMEEQLIRVSGWTVHDLPTVKAHDSARISITPKLKSWLSDIYSLNGESDQDRLQKLAAAALDQGMLPAERYRQITGDDPPAVNVGYVNWWITGSYDGMVAFAWVCFRDNDVTRDEVAAAMSKDSMLLTELTREIEKLSRPSPNG